MKLGVDPLKVLDFDVECRPGAWIGGDYVSRSLTAIAWSWVGSGKVQHVVLNRRDTSTKRLLEAFLPHYAKAEIVTGHFVKGFDLPLLSYELQANRMPVLEQKLIVDTKIDLVKGLGGSKSQQNLGAIFETEHPKIPVSVPGWESFNLWLSPAGTKVIVDRVRGDVLQHGELYTTLQELGYLRPPRVWTP